MDSTLFIDVPYSQQQNGVSDCGLFTIAFAVHLAPGDDAAALSFDQSKMREHLLKCFQRKTMMPFPQTKAGPRTQTYFPPMEIELLCTCQMLETYDDMVECDYPVNVSCDLLLNAENRLRGLALAAGG